MDGNKVGLPSRLQYKSNQILGKVGQGGKYPWKMAQNLGNQSQLRHRPFLQHQWQLHRRQFHWAFSLTHTHLLTFHLLSNELIRHGFILYQQASLRVSLHFIPTSLRNF